MILTENDIHIIVEGVIERLLEYHSVIDKRYEVIAKEATQEINNGNFNFIIEGIKFVYRTDNGKKVASYSPRKHTIFFDNRLIGATDSKKIEVLMHELCHHVNFSSGYNKTDPYVSINTLAGKKASDISYLFSETEINSRLTQLYYAIRNEMFFNLEDIEKLALLPRMSSLLLDIRYDEFIDYNSDNERYAYNSIVAILYAIECEKKEQD